MVLLAGVAFAVGTVMIGGFPGVPERHQPCRMMGRDCWRKLYKYQCYGWKAGADNNVRMDNPSLLALPAFADAAPEYVAAAPRPSPDSRLAVHALLKDNFANEPDVEILSSNPRPDRPLFLVRRSERDPGTWGSPVKLDYCDYARWRAAHPNLVADGNISEWCNDLNVAYDSLSGVSCIYEDTTCKNEEQRAALARLILPRPASRYEQVAVLRRYYEMRKERNYGGKMAVLDAHLNSLHLAADFGASYLRMESTASGEYRYQVSAMFARGAARQFGVPWEWYVAGYANSFATNGEFWGDTMCSYLVGDGARTHWRGSVYEGAEWPTGRIRIGNGGPDYGISRSLFRRTHYLAYLSGANVIALEEWPRVLQMWSSEQKRTVLSPRGEIYVEFAGFMRAHPDRGAHYSPVAICVPIAQGYPTWGGSPWDEKRFGYTDGDRAVDAVFFTLVPGRDYVRLLAKGEEMCLRNTPYADMYDVVSPDAGSQSEEEVLAVMKAYKALVVVGDYRDSAWENALRRYQEGGGRVMRVGVAELNQSDGTGDVRTGTRAYPRLQRMFAELQKDYFPFVVEGACQHGLLIARDHLWLYAFNNDGVTKFADSEERLQEAKSSRICISGNQGRGCRLGKDSSVRELLSGKSVSADGGSFSWLLKPGDLAVFEIK